MKFTCTKENISQALGLVGGVAGKQTSLPILTNVLISAKEAGVEIIGTNLEIAIKTHLRAKVEIIGNFTVPAKMLADYIYLLPDQQITCSLEGKQLFVECGSSSTKIKGMAHDDFPVIPEIEEKHAYSINAHDLKISLQKVVIATSKNEIRPELAGVNCHMFPERFAGLVLAATDSYRLAEKKTLVSQGKDEVSCIIPSRSVHEMIRLLGAQNTDETNVRLWISDNQIAVKYGNVEMTSRLTDGKYPDYTQIIPEDFKTVATVLVDELAKRIKAASLFTADGVNAVSFDLNSEQNTLSVSSTSTQAGEHISEVDCKVIGQENSTLLNHKYMLDGLQQIDGEKVQFCVNSSDAPCLLRPTEKNEYLYIVMPIRQ